ncbi:MAG TPA: AcrB/AcrD/AcrF family protein, partial [Bdellovibrionales bacterium]|nr:AcrB/AcrD/AcrF family protein [Bdellovibrionales bacterium]
SVVRLETQSTFESISRQNRQRTITVFSNVTQGKSQADALNSAEIIAKEVLPTGYSIVLSGSSETFRESFAGLLLVLVLGIVVSYMVLGSQFDSFVDPITVLMALPFSISGAFLALLIGGQSLNIYSLIGMILLMGIVKKNSILLVDFTNQIRRRKQTSVNEALLEACPIRLRPISMTSLATIAGAIPPALALGPGSETRVPMAIAVIGGIIVSTTLTLLVVPCVYSLFFKLRKPERAQLKLAA